MSEWGWCALRIENFLLHCCSTNRRSHTGCVVRFRTWFKRWCSAASFTFPNSSCLLRGASLSQLSTPSALLFQDTAGTPWWKSAVCRKNRKRKRELFLFLSTYFSLSFGFCAHHTFSVTPSFPWPLPFCILLENKLVLFLFPYRDT